MSHNPPNANGNGSFTPMNALVTVGDALVAAAAKAQAIGALRPRITFGETGEEKGLVTPGLEEANGFPHLQKPEPLHKEEDNYTRLLANDPEIRKRLDFIDRLRSFDLKAEGFQLPTIVVIGDQSSGKTSTLESIAGIELPKGTGIVTRNPLIIRMVRLDPSSGAKEYTIISSDKLGKKKRIDDLGDVPKFIREFTEGLSGRGSNVTEDDITLEVYKTDVNDLTLIDLPGITRNPVKGQDENIEETIKNMILKYITHQEAVILNICSAHVDFSTCEAIKLSRQVDKEGVRTIGVCTKIDEAVRLKGDKVVEQVLATRDTDVKLKYGWHAIRNRTDEEIRAKTPIPALRAAERRLFAKPPLCDLPDENKGVGQLVRRLVIIQNARIRATLPMIANQVHQKLRDIRMKLAEMGEVVDDGSQAQLKFEQLMTKFVNRVSDSCSEASAVNNEDRAISSEFHQKFLAFQQTIHSTSTSFLSSFYAQYIESVISKTIGIGLPNTLSNAIIIKLFLKEKRKTETPAYDLIGNIKELTMGCLQEHCDAVFGDVPRLKVLVWRCCEGHLDGLRSLAVERVGVEHEKEEDTYTMNHYYMDTVNKIREKVLLARKHMEETKMESKLRNVLPGNKESQSGLKIHTDKDGECEFSFPVNDDEDVKLSFSELTRGAASNESHLILEFQIVMQSYWKVFFKRYVDNIVLNLRTIFYRLLSNPDNLRTVLQSDRTLRDADVLLKCFGESDEDGEKRRGLRISVERLERAAEEIRRVVV